MDKNEQGEKSVELAGNNNVRGEKSVELAGNNIVRGEANVKQKRIIQKGETNVKQKRIIQKGEANVKQKSSLQKENKQSSLFMDLLKKNCTEIGIPQSPSILKNSQRFFDERLLKLEFLNEQMMEIYSRAILFAMNQKNVVKSKFVGKIKKAIFDKALEEIQEWMKTRETEELVNKDDFVCNLYSILQ